MSRGASRIEYTYLQDGREVRAGVPLNRTGEDGTLLALIRENRLTSIHSSEPTLSDIFMELTGRLLQ
jgi:fluoroquinolone transport system ATP-binding protein